MVKRAVQYNVPGVFLELHEQLHNLRPYGTSYRELTAALNSRGIEVSLPQLNRVLTGKAPLKPWIAYHTWEAMGRPNALSYLRDRYSTAAVMSEISQTPDNSGIAGALDQHYRDEVRPRLQAAMQSLPIEERASLLNDLETVIAKYEKDENK